MSRSQLLYALLATLCWGSYIVVAKVASAPRYCALAPRWTTLLMGVGIVAVFAWYWVTSERGPLQASAGSLAAGIGAGLLWALGMVFALLALRGGADVARLVPLYNANTVVALVLAVVLLREVPAGRDLARIAVGSGLVVIGGLLVAR